MKTFSIALPLLSVSAHFNMVTVSKRSTGEEGIKADFIIFNTWPFILFVGCHKRLAQYSSVMS